MAKKRISMEKIRKIIRLHEEMALSNRAVAKALHVSRTAVNDYIRAYKDSGLKYIDIKNINDIELIESLKPRIIKSKEKHEELSRYFEYFLKELKRQGVTIQILWEEYKEKHRGGYSYAQFCYHFAKWRKDNQVTMHIEHKAGDKMFADFTGKKLVIVDQKTGEFKEVETFVAILGASGNTYVEAIPSQNKEDWIKANEEALLYFDGVPKAIVPDCLKSGVKNGNKYEPDINPEYDDFASHYGTVILPARPYHAKDKALVENAVKLVYMRIFAPLRNRVFFSLEELNEAIWELLEKHNNTKYQRLDVSRKQLFEEIEKDELKPLPSEKYELRYFLNLKVQFNYHIYLNEDKHYYSVPWQYKGKKVKIIYTSRAVEIYHNNIRIAFHYRDRRPGGYTTKKEHMPPHHSFYAEWSPQRFLSWAEKIGPYVKVMVGKVLESRKHPEQAFRACLGILNLVKKYKSERLDMACKRALYFGSSSYKAIKNILEKGLDRVKEELPFQKHLPVHENIRGNKYFMKEVINE